MTTGKYEIEETNLIRHLLKEIDTFVNIGAHVGYYCLHALQLGKQVIAVEPMERNVHYLLRNLSDNNWTSSSEVFPQAVADCSGVIEIWGGGGATGTGASIVKGFSGNPASYVRRVPVVTLDRLLSGISQKKRLLILVDVDGAEYSLLQGSRETLQCKPRPIWFMEIVTTTNQPKGIHVNPNLVATFETFFANGYKAVTADLQQNPVSFQEVNAVAEGKLDFTTQNFIFR